jgi:hypothetical protein
MYMAVNDPDVFFHSQQVGSSWWHFNLHPVTEIGGPENGLKPVVLWRHRDKSVQPFPTSRYFATSWKHG